MIDLLESDGLEEAVFTAFDDPDWFCREVLRCPNDPWQTELLEAMLDGERHLRGYDTVVNHKGLNKITVRSPHNPGKTHFMAKAMHLFNFIHYRGRIVATAPKENQLKTRLWPEFRKILGSSIKPYRDLIKVDALKITWGGNVDWTALAETASASENLAGHHEDYLLIVMDEASGVREELFPVVESTLGSGIFTCLIMIGNPTRNTGSFYQSHMRDKVAKQYYRKHIHPDEAPRVSKQWIADMISKYGKNSPVVKVRCYGEFAEMGDDQLLSLEWIQEARDRTFHPDGSIPRLRLSIDVADGGMDETVIHVQRNYQSFTHWLKMKRYSFPSSKSPIMAADAMEIMFDAYDGDKRYDDMVVDSIGVGAGTAGTLIRRGYRVVTYKGGAASDEPKKWRNRRTQSYLVMRNEFRDGQIVISDDYCDDEDWEDAVAQLCSIKTKPGTERVEDLLTKKELLKMIEKSPDIADAEAMGCATQSPEMSIQIDAALVVGELDSAQYLGEPA